MEAAGPSTSAAREEGIIAIRIVLLVVIYSCLHCSCHNFMYAIFYSTLREYIAEAAQKRNASCQRKKSELGSKRKQVYIILYI